MRDLLLRIDNFDMDIVIEGDGIKFSRAFGKELNAKVVSHQKFGTSVVNLPDGFKVDVATARTEYYKHPAALPTVEMSSIKSDLFRRGSRGRQHPRPHSGRGAGKTHGRFER